MGCKACCPQRSAPAIENTTGKEGRNRMQELQHQHANDALAKPSSSVVLYLEGLECVCPTDPEGDNLMILFIAGVSFCAIAGGVFGTFVPRAFGFDEYEPMCTATAATIFTVAYSTVFDSLGFLEKEQEEVKPSKDVNGVLLKGVLTQEHFKALQTEGQLEVGEWKSEDEDEIILKVNGEEVVGAGTNLCNQTNMKSGDFVPIDRSFTPKHNRFTFELEEWDIQSANNKLVPFPAGLYRVNSLTSNFDFTRGSKNGGLYFVSTTNKSIFVLYGRLEVEA